jgi:integrase
MTSDAKLQRAIRTLGKKEVVRLLEKHLVVSRDDVKPKKGITFKELADIWKAQVLPNHKASSQSSGLGRLTVLLATFGNCSLTTIDAASIQAWVSRLSCAPKTVTNYVSLFRAIWQTGVDYGYARGNPFSGLRLPAPELSEQPCFSPEQSKEIIRRASEPFKTLFWIIAETGIRGGEAVALKPSDIDLERCTIRIQRSAFKGNVQTPKTRNSIRSFAISQQLARHLAQFLASGSLEFIFCTNSGRPLNNTWVATNKLKPILRVMGIDRPRAGLHGFRHGLATALDRMDVPMHERQARLGHGSAGMTMRYTHGSGGGQAVADKLGELFSPVEKANAAGAD